MKNNPEIFQRVQILGDLQLTEYRDDSQHSMELPRSVKPDSAPMIGETS